MIKNNNNNHKKRKLRLDAARLSQLSLSRIIRLPSLTPPLMVLLSFMLLLVALPTDTYAKYILLAGEDSHMKVAGFEHKVSSARKESCQRHGHLAARPYIPFWYPIKAPMACARPARPAA